uniref:Bm4944, isoform d n=1 Tax=Brugia malayi TaxID=6279 RepID=A0A0J9XUV5_BRUMA|nr:Bm4944, isoform d [Brugia malayi]
MRSSINEKKNNWQSNIANKFRLCLRLLRPPCLISL